MDSDTAAELVAEGWTPPGQVQDLVALDDAVELLRTLLPEAVAVTAVDDLPEPDGHIGGMRVWLRPTIERFITDADACRPRT